MGRTLGDSSKLHASRAAKLTTSTLAEGIIACSAKFGRGWRAEGTVRQPVVEVAPAEFGSHREL